MHLVHLRLSKLFLGLAAPAVLVALVSLTRVWSADGPPPDGWSAEERRPSGSRPKVVSYSGQDVELGEVLRSFADQIGAELDLDPGVRGRISLDLRRARFEAAMTDLCTAFRCTWALAEAPERRLTVRPKPAE